LVSSLTGGPPSSELTRLSLLMPLASWFWSTRNRGFFSPPLARTDNGTLPVGEVATIQANVDPRRFTKDLFDLIDLTLISTLIRQTPFSLVFYMHNKFQLFCYCITYKVILLMS